MKKNKLLALPFFDKIEFMEKSNQYSVSHDDQGNKVVRKLTDVTPLTLALIQERQAHGLTGSDGSTIRAEVRQIQEANAKKKKNKTTTQEIAANLALLDED